MLDMAGYFALSAAIYFYIGRDGVAPVEVVNASWVPFLPVLALPYLLQVIVSYALIVMLSDRTLGRAHSGGSFPVSWWARWRLSRRGSTVLLTW